MHAQGLILSFLFCRWAESATQFWIMLEISTMLHANHADGSPVAVWASLLTPLWVEIFKMLYLDDQTELGGLPQHKSYRIYKSYAFENMSDTFVNDLEGAELNIDFFKVR